MNKDKIIEVIYVLAAFCFFTYLFTKKSVYMFCGGLLLIVASTMLIINNKNKK